MNTKEKTIDALEELINALQTELKYLKEWETAYTPEELAEYINENPLAEFLESLKEATQ
jgi:hypothetical protein